MPNEPTLLGLVPPKEHLQCKAENEQIATIAEAEGSAASLRAAVASLGGVGWAKLDTKTQDERLIALAGPAPFVRPHLIGLNTLEITEEDVSTLHTPTLLFYGANRFWFEAFIARQFRALRPDLKVINVENAPHNVHRDRADMLNGEALAFLSK